MFEAGDAGLMTLGELRSQIQAGRVDTVVLAVADMQGRLQGKRFHASYFLEEVVPNSAEACTYIFAVDVDMRTVDGYEMSSWDLGYGDFVMQPDFETLRRLPWHPGTVLCIADACWEDGSAVTASPRAVLRGQIERLADHGWRAMVGTELEFVVFQDTYEEAWRKKYRDLVPANLYNVDYSLLGTARIEPLLRRIRNDMAGAGLVPESAKGECNLGQHEIGFRYGEALDTADRHVVYKTGSKEIAAQEGMSITFMAKLDTREGSSCHIHLSLLDLDDEAVFDRGGEAPMSKTFEHFLAGLIASARELTLMFAPNVNSYKRFAAGSFAPTALLWGFDNRTCAFRVIGRGKSLRVENRVPGADVNPYLAIAAMIAAGLHGIEHELPLEPPYQANAYDAKRPQRIPGTLAEAMELFEKSSIAVHAFGEEVVKHYTNMARVELEAFDAAVTDWELMRGFERL